MNYPKGRPKKRVNCGEKGQNKPNLRRLFSFPSLNSLQPKANWFYLPLTCLLVLGLVACGGSTPTASQSDDADSSPQESNLTFFDVTLEQADEVGRPVWKVRSKKAIYTKEKQIGEAENPVGELYQDGKPVYQIQADKADIEQDGQKLFLKGKILATDPVNGIVLQGNELEWLPQEDLLIVRNQLNGTHKQLKAVAQEARVKTREQRIEFSGGVIANSVDPQMQMRSESLTWRIKEETLTSDRPIQIDRYNNNKITDRGQGDAAEVNLKTKIATIKKNAQLELVDPPTQIASNSMIWDMNAETVKTNSPITVVQRAENVTVTANQGEMKIQQKIVNLTGNVNAIGQRRQSLKSNQLNWYLDKKLLEAQGNVIYRQVDPPINFTGETAVGNLQTEDIVVKSGKSGGRVVTEIIPQDAGISN
ncbi:MULTISPECIES: LPS export ABC transporter periplasmic protein LptC [unclassified Nodularia (in: cyanobacteria)]|uniref:LPS export ABC transporter periplasmic protein LptC n=1 Tax=unclassified Nodularia (in: cyanobacteria) TaxID=2656917 RepID=UPI001D11B58F|nr:MULTISPECIES: LPS export ABC transporter periplasmic protein LptC [unclassified Nodularia (in: cyanobacteria)]